MEQDYLMVNQNTNIVENICTWDGNTNTWEPPINTLMVVQATTPAMVWELDTTLLPPDFVLIEQMGAGSIGFTWDGVACITNEPKPSLPIPANDQPTNSGTIII